MSDDKTRRGGQDGDPVRPQEDREDPPRGEGRPGSDAWTPDPAQPGGTPARRETPPGAPGTDAGTR